MTVKQVAEKVYGPISEGATLHLDTFEWLGDLVVAWVDVDPDNINSMHLCEFICPLLEGKIGDVKLRGFMDSGWHKLRYRHKFPDISDRDASAFLGFFGKEFDEAVLDSGTYVQEIGSYEQER